jgi:hypothetical protein
MRQTATIIVYYDVEKYFSDFASAARKSGGNPAAGFLEPHFSRAFTLGDYGTRKDALDEFGKLWQ